MTEAQVVIDAVQKIKSVVPYLKCEVPILGRSADFVCVDNNSLLSIEFKLHNWRKAIKQAKDHQFAADYAYVCMPERNITDLMREAFVLSGIGLYFYVENTIWPFKEIIPAKKSACTWEPVKTKTMKYLLA